MQLVLGEYSIRGMNSTHYLLPLAARHDKAVYKLLSSNSTLNNVQSNALFDLSNKGFQPLPRIKLY